MESTILKASLAALGSVWYPDLLGLKLEFRGCLYLHTVWYPFFLNDLSGVYSPSRVNRGTISVFLSVLREGLTETVHYPQRRNYKLTHSRYKTQIFDSTKIILTSSVIADERLVAHLKSFESSVGVSRKAFRLGKFVQDVNALRAAHVSSRLSLDLLLSAVAYGGEGHYYFIEQFVWLGKAGLIDKRHLPALQKWSAWCEFLGYFGSVGLKIGELKTIDKEEKCLESTIDTALVRGVEFGAEQEKLCKLREKKMMKRLSVVQDLADGLMALADIRDSKGPPLAPLVVSSAGLLSTLISTHKNWISC